MVTTVALLLLLALASGSYVPGKPGTDWSLQELVIVKAKLYRLFEFDFTGHEIAPKAVRLGFHDCLRYSDRSGGCDGCLNWKNVGTRREDPGLYKCALLMF